MSDRKLTTKQIVRALSELDPLPGRRRQILIAHCRMTGHVATASELARKVGYRHFGGLNLQYGLLANSIGRFCGRPEATLSTLVEFVRRESPLRNREWLLVMRQEVVAALKELGWVDCQSRSL